MCCPWIVSNMTRLHFCVFFVLLPLTFPTSFSNKVSKRSLTSDLCLRSLITFVLASIPDHRILSLLVTCDRPRHEQPHLNTGHTLCPIAARLEHQKIKYDVRVPPMRGKYSSSMPRHTNLRNSPDSLSCSANVVYLSEAVKGF